MKRSAPLFTKLLLLVSLMLASLPSGATETVCVLDGGKREVAVAKCGMPCCAGEPAPAKRSCCAPKLAKPTPQFRRCGVSKACRCETRLAKSNSPTPAATVASTDRLNELPAILALADLKIPTALLVYAEPGIVGLDAGPPRKRPRTPQQSRAPPIAFF